MGPALPPRKGREMTNADQTILTMAGNIMANLLTQTNSPPTASELLDAADTAIKAAGVLHSKYISIYSGAGTYKNVIEPIPRDVMYFL